MDDFELELKRGFIEEADQAIGEIEQCFLVLEANPSDQETLNKIFRLAHNLKGSSKAVGFDQMGLLTHEFETFVLRIKNAELRSGAKVVSLLLKIVDFIKHMLTELKADLSAKFEIDPIVNQLIHFNADEVTTDDALAEDIGFSAEMLQAIDNLPELLNNKKNSPPAPKPVNSEESIRVTLTKLEKLLNSVGELVILQSMLSQKCDNENLDMKKTVHQLSKVTKEVQDISMGLRMVPIKPSFQKMQRIVRDTSQLLDKEVILITKGDDTELDKTVLESITDPLVHLIRNSVDHGIEKAVDRITVGKPMQGKIELKAYHQSGRLIIEISDDGAGIDQAKIKEKALSKGLVKSVDSLSEQDCLDLIFSPGFSTKESVTEVSGRGIGMDVVKSNIENLGGEITIQSKTGEGSTFKLSLPLTLAIVDGMVLSVCSQKYVIPLSHIHETLQPKPEQLHYSSDLGLVLMLRGENIPLIRLGDFFGLRGQLAEEDMIAILIRSGQKPFAVLVDDIIGQQQIVVKQLSPDLQGIKGISGTTILGDGKPYMILEPQELLLRKISYTDLKKSKTLNTNQKVNAA